MWGCRYHPTVCLFSAVAGKEQRPWEDFCFRHRVGLKHFDITLQYDLRRGQAQEAMAIAL